MRGLNCPLISLCSNLKYLVSWPTTPFLRRLIVTQHHDLSTCSQRPNLWILTESKTNSNIPQCLGSWVNPGLGGGSRSWFGGGLQSVLARWILFLEDVDILPAVRHGDFRHGLDDFLPYRVAHSHQGVFSHGVREATVAVKSEWSYQLICTTDSTLYFLISF